MIRRPPRSTPLYSSAASDVYKRQELFSCELRALTIIVIAHCFYNRLYRIVTLVMFIANIRSPVVDTQAKKEDVITQETESEEMARSAERDKVDFVAVATPLVERGFRVTSVHPETKMGVMKN